MFHSGNITTHYSSLYFAEQDSSGNWVNQNKLSERGSQGTLFYIPETSYILVAYELENHERGNTLAIRFYENLDKLRRNNYLYEYQLDQFIDKKQVRNIGTPSLEKISLTKSHNDPQYNEYYL